MISKIAWWMLWYPKSRGGCHDIQNHVVDAIISKITWWMPWYPKSRGGCYDIQNHVVDAMISKITWWMPWYPKSRGECHDIQNHEVNEETGLPAISYHWKRYQFLTLKSSLDKIAEALKNRLHFASFTTSNESDTRPKRGNSKLGTVLLPKDCIFCRKKISTKTSFWKSWWSV